jgi:hypothetical protein
MVHHIMEHTAHHVDMSIPLYRLKKAQAKLEEMLPGRIIVQPFSWGWYFKTAKACKLYDFTRECWTDFQGHMTSPVRGNLPSKPLAFSTRPSGQFRCNKALLKKRFFIVLGVTKSQRLAMLCLPRFLRTHRHR